MYPTITSRTRTTCLYSGDVLWDGSTLIVWGNKVFLLCACPRATNLSDITCHNSAAMPVSWWGFDYRLNGP